MASKTATSDEDIDPQAFAPWNDEGGGPGPLKWGASRLRLHDAVELENTSYMGLWYSG
jgi:hypothetical protein